VKLNELIDYLYLQLESLQIPTRRYNGVREKALLIPRQKPQSPIFALLTPEPRSLAKYCQDGGFVVRPIVPPTVPEGTQRVRVCLHAGNTTGDIDGLVGRIREWLGKEEDIAVQVPSVEFKAAL
jgi:8-amino-7-oxononanoate synthase